MCFDFPPSFNTSTWSFVRTVSFTSRTFSRYQRFSIFSFRVYLPCYTPRERSSGGYIGITLSVRLSVRPSVCPDSCPAHNFFMVWHWLTIFGTWVYHHETMCRGHSWSRYNLELWPQGQIYRVFDMFSCPAHNFFFRLTLAYHIWHMDVSPSDNVSRTFKIPIQCWPFTSRSNFKAFVVSSCTTCNFWHWHIKFGRLVYHHERMCQVHSWSWYNLKLWHQGQIYRVYDIALLFRTKLFCPLT